MKRLPAAILLVTLAASVGGCAAYRSVFPGPAAPAPVPVAAAQPAPDDGIQRIAFRTGVSSATVEKLARQQACTGGQGAGLVTEPGPVEVYRMACDNGKVFRARCEMRQCKQM
jgi:hypothetical protein